MILPKEPGITAAPRPRGRIGHAAVLWRQTPAAVRGLLVLVTVAAGAESVAYALSGGERLALIEARRHVHLGMTKADAMQSLRARMQGRGVVNEVVDGAIARVDVGLVASWAVRIRCVDGIVVEIRAATENGPYRPEAFPPNECAIGFCREGAR